MSIRIYISTYGNKVYLKKCMKKYCLPIEVGSVTRDKDHRVSYKLRDDIAQNISELNPYYGELTGQYWVWKNRKSDYIGFYHYNKYMNLGINDIADKLKNKDIILLKSGMCVNGRTQDGGNFKDRRIQDGGNFKDRRIQDRRTPKSRRRKHTGSAAYKKKIEVQDHDNYYWEKAPQVSARFI